ncbi:LPS assembly lipoprotein LptE [uncultured Sulfitobacter sp.]|uniref:LPS assembly lipoprotein LptE n=1 Tax=uncultured Sulfitobacter sp. TaxID=191468 RepID=UPI00261DCEDA|nr:LPS assembly lipoprotein LptE [uncultured Sulfitobacter sp.]
MSLYSRRSLIALPLVALAACGFTPVYGTGGTGAQLRGQVLVQEPSSQAGYLLTRQLETRLGRSGTAARYALDLTIDLEEDGLAINATGDITRFNLIGRVQYALRDTSTGAIITSDTVENFTAYSATGTTVATLASERDAVERLMVILGDQITARLYAAALPA